MVASVLATKLHRPAPGSTVVSRDRLLTRLDEGVRGALTLVSAPAGFGKTTLVSTWTARSPYPVAWLSLDEGDGEAGRFLTYLVAALRTLEPDLGERVLAALRSAQAPVTEALLTELVNELAALPRRSILVLDDLHAPDSRDMDEALAFLLQHLPEQLRVVGTTRADPDLPLARMRVKGQLTEIRAADLRFTVDESAAFLRDVMGVELDAGDIAALEMRTEGWIAGLQLAALSMRGRDDAHGFVEAFAGDHHYIVEYLADEVLQHQEPHVREFLVRTSILDRLCGPLCDAVADTDDGAELLRSLHRENLFLVPLDDSHTWYRYHHLFADVLRAHLRTGEFGEAEALHGRASAWYDAAGSPADAIRHALAAGDTDLAASLVEREGVAMRRSFQDAQLLRWIGALPEHAVRARPGLALEHAAALMDLGRIDESEAWLAEAERALGAAPREGAGADAGIRDARHWYALRGRIAAARVYHAQARGDAATTAERAERALELLPEDDDAERGVVASLLGLAYWAEGDLGAAQTSFSRGIADMKRAGNVVVAVASSYILADIRIARGRLGEAVRTYEDALSLAAEQGDPPPVGVANAHLGLAELYRERGDAVTSAEHMARSQALYDGASVPDTRYRWCLAEARLHMDRGDGVSAVASLEEAERLYYRLPIPDVRPIAAMKARALLELGKIAEADAWVRSRGLHVDVPAPSYLGEYAHLVLVRLAIARRRLGLPEAGLGPELELLARMLRLAEGAGRDGSVLEILLLLALAHEARGSIGEGLEALARALALAEGEGYVRAFVDEGPAMAHLLAEARDAGIATAYGRRLLGAFDAADALDAGGAQAQDAYAESLLEPLTDREIEVLRLIAQGLSNEAISRRLYRALSTVKGYNRSIFAKLQVARRTEAVARGRELGLL